MFFVVMLLSFTVVSANFITDLFNNDRSNSITGKAIWEESPDIIYTTGNVGIGTTTPKLKLHIIGTDAPQSVSATPNGAIMIGGGASGWVMTQGIDGSKGQGWIQTRSVSVARTFGSLVLQPSGGNVGIGTPIPEGKLNIFVASAGSVTPAGANDLIIESNTHAGLTILTPTNVESRIFFGTPTASSDSRIVHDGTVRDLSFWTGTTEKMTISLTGNVGIGTSTPKKKLQVEGDLYLNGNLITRDPNGACFSCGPDNNDNWVCSPVSCPQ
tara:strand:+ start:297 stop:1106 length:810 start_codon:yes stop_codon:yes gene_type:complete